MLQEGKVKPGIEIGDVHITVDEAEAIAATALGHAVSCTEATLSSDSMVASAGFVTFALRNGASLTGILPADGDT